ncbi:hypothetical protein F5Y17DRAFT_325641 [Xylariaceae sp. FL0594]|nr:hypothetical protein F5Y17DRAFT_325641 [Xylariaceae sp. FL0594]
MSQEYWSAGRAMYHDSSMLPADAAHGGYPSSRHPPGTGSMYAGSPVVRPSSAFPSAAPYHTSNAPYQPYHNSQGWPAQPRFSRLDSVEYAAYLSDYTRERPRSHGGSGSCGRRRSSRRSGNRRDEFEESDVQFLPRPPTSYVSMQEREMPQLPTHLSASEQASLLACLNDRLSRCAFDFVAKHQLPIPLTLDMRRVERPQDRTWTEWVQLLKKLTNRRRIPARVLYEEEIGQFVNILENTLELGYAAPRQRRRLRDDRNVLQLISAGTQAAKMLQDTPAMEYMDGLYVSTDRQIRANVAKAAAAGRIRSN